MIITAEVLIHLPEGSYTIPRALYNQLVKRHGEDAALSKIDQYKETDDQIKPFRPKIYYADMGADTIAEVPKISHSSNFAF